MNWKLKSKKERTTEVTKSFYFFKNNSTFKCVYWQYFINMDVQ